MFGFGLMTLATIINLILTFVSVSMASTTTYGLIILLSACSFFCSIWILSVAFNDNVMEGVLCFFVPFYVLYYTFKNWEEMCKPMTLQLICTMFNMLNFVFMVIHQVQLVTS